MPSGGFTSQIDEAVCRREWILTERLDAAQLPQAVTRHFALDGVQADRLIRHRGIFADRKRWQVDDMKASPILEAGTRIRVYLHANEPETPGFDANRVVMRSPDYVVVDKPSGLVCQPTRASVLVCLEHVVSAFENRSLFCAHRLDRETSGLVILVANRESAAEFGRQFADRAIKKEYVAVVSPAPDRDAWTVEGDIFPLAPCPVAVFGFSPTQRRDGKYSLTNFEVTERRGQTAVVRACPQTGRTHQIRLHLRASGTPIVGDRLYGCLSSGVCERLQLHARRLVFKDSRMAEPVTVTAEPGGDFGVS